MTDRTAPQSITVLDALHSTPSRRYLSPEPIPVKVIRAILDAAIRGPNGGNRQAWGWVVVTDPAIKTTIAPWYRDGWQRAYGHRRDELLVAEPDPSGSGMTRASFLAADHLAATIEQAPVWVFPVLRGAADSTNPRLGSSIYGAVQQLILAARAYGIGSTLTTLHVGHEAQVRELLGLPADAATMALIPLGYPARGRWVEPKRQPLDQVVHWNGWGHHSNPPPTNE